eukprot:m.93103 g.93103  ORF g.93103 m.93103 type:complete len:52 (-) comp13382_c0_seq1:47-202(-)
MFISDQDSKLKSCPTEDAEKKKRKMYACNLCKVVSFIMKGYGEVYDNSLAT